MTYDDWFHGHDLKCGDKVKTISCSYEDGEIIWEAALKHGIKKHIAQQQLSGSPDGSPKSCPECDGNGTSNWNKCSYCNGNGQIFR